MGTEKLCDISIKSVTWDVTVGHWSLRFVVITYTGCIALVRRMTVNYELVTV